MPVLMVIANQDFYYQEYAHTREELEAAGLQVEVAAAATTIAVPHPNSGQGQSSGAVMPDLAVTDADASSYSAIVFVGGWGSSMYQYAFAGTYVNPAYNGAPETEAAVNRLINDFAAQDKYVTAICHGVSVLAWARVDGVSPIEGKTVSAYALGSPSWQGNTQYPDTTRWHIETNGATMVPSRSIGDPATAADDVMIDGRIITAENYDTARMFGRTIAERLLAEMPPENTPPQDLAIAGPSLAVRGQTVTFAGTFTDPDQGDAHTQSWQMIDVSGNVVWTGTGATFDFTPLDAGTFTVAYTVTDAAGSAETMRKQLEARVHDLMPDPMDPTKSALYVGGALGNDRLFFYVQPRTNDVRVVLNNQWIGTFSGVARIIAYGQAGNDWIGIYGTGRIASWMDGGQGNDFLKGGYLDDVLFGGAGNDVIWAGPGGRDLLIGGDGRDALYGRWRGTRSIQEYADFTLTAGRVRELLEGW
jgi:putative intracellular protease/amidase